MRDRTGRRAVLVAVPLALGLVLARGRAGRGARSPRPAKSEGIAVRSSGSPPHGPRPSRTS